VVCGVIIGVSLGLAALIAAAASLGETGSPLEAGVALLPVCFAALVVNTRR